ncbi:MAG: hypothetical protein MUC68_04170, partial [Burkholderiaceae bacterium]|nr:hypothetical protein [Burkholderiaceae bacterium]
MPSSAADAARFAPDVLRRLRRVTIGRGPQALDGFFDRLPHARRRVLMLDYDGTLAPFQADRFQAHPYRGARELLARIHTQSATRLVIVSGRPAREAADLLGLAPRPETWGVHGWERLTPSGQLVRAILPQQAKLALHRLLALRPQLEDCGALVEEKYASVAVHTRGIGAAEASAGADAHDASTAHARVRALLAEFEPPADGQARLDGVYLQAFDGGWELRAHGPNKGSVVRGVLREESRDTLIAYLGDDLTDEDLRRPRRPRPHGARAAARADVGRARAQQRRATGAAGAGRTARVSRALGRDRAGRSGRINRPSGPRRARQAGA